VVLVADLPQDVPASPRARDTDRFEDEFWKGGDLAELYQRTSQSRTGSGMDHIFTAGFREYAKHRKQGSASS
jgi:biopolymer transport protein TolQ